MLNIMRIHVHILLKSVETGTKRAYAEGRAVAQQAPPPCIICRVH